MFNAEKFIEKTVPKLRGEIQGKTLIAFSGGVDSTVCAALVNQAIGDQLIAVHVDTGYMRKNESENAKKMMEEMTLNFRFVDASKEFYASLKDIEEPEKKRKIIGEKFIHIFEKVAEEEETVINFSGIIKTIDGHIWKVHVEDEIRIVDVSEALIRVEPEIGLRVLVAGIVEDDITIALEVDEAEE